MRFRPALPVVMTFGGLIMAGFLVLQTLIHTDGLDETDLMVIGVVDPGDGVKGKSTVVAPPADTVFCEGEVLLLLGRIDNLNPFTTTYQTS